MDLSRIKIAYHDHGRKMWLIRASGGKYINHFRQSGVVTIGHLDDIYDHRTEDTDQVPTLEKIEQLLLRNAEYSKAENSTSKKRKLTPSGISKLQQIGAFKHIKKGDFIISVDPDFLLIGICNEDAPYLDSKPVRIEIPEEKKRTRKEPAPLQQRLRRSVTWGPILSRYRLPSAIKKTFQGRRTVISLDKHWDKFLHLIYPFFIDENNLYISNKIGTSAPINNLVISGLLQNISLTQFIANNISQEKSIDLNLINEILSLNIDLSDFDSTSKAEFMSPGDIWSKIPLNDIQDKASYIIACVLVSLVLNGHADIKEILDSSEETVTTANYTAPNSMASDIFIAPQKKVRKEKILEEIENQQQPLESLNNQRKSKLINKKLILTLPTVDTRSLENIEHGIPTTKVLE